jgi:unspecific monooxygenase
MESLPYFDPAEPAVVADPYPHYARYRAQDPVHLAPCPSTIFPERWFLFRHADVAAALRDPRLGRDWHRVTEERTRRPIPEPVRELVAMVDGWMLSVDPPLHTELRGAVSDAFRPRALAHLEGPIASAAAALLEERASGPFDVLADFALPLTSGAIADVLGIPDSERAEFLAATRGLEAVFGGAPAELPRAAAAALELSRLFERCIATASGGIVARFKDAEGDARRRAIGTCIFLYGAGFATTVHAIGNGVLALTRTPGEWTALRERPELLDTAVEEVLRFDPPTQRSQRFSAESLEIGGRVIPRGALVVPVLGSANRDAAVFAEPERFDPARDSRAALSFGGGIHSCLGAWLARLELRVALSALMRRFADLAPTGEPLEWRETAARGLRRLRVAGILAPCSPPT